MILTLVKFAGIMAVSLAILGLLVIGLLAALSLPVVMEHFDG